MSSRNDFEKWCRANNGIPARLKGTDQYIVEVVQASWQAWQASEANTIKKQVAKDAYDGAREDLLIWKKRALEAEALIAKYLARHGA